VDRLGGAGLLNKCLTVRNRLRLTATLARPRAFSQKQPGLRLALADDCHKTEHNKEVISARSAGVDGRPGYRDGPRTREDTASLGRDGAVWRELHRDQHGVLTVRDSNNNGSASSRERAISRSRDLNGAIARFDARGNAASG